jgi:hypothetical protein
MTDDEILKEYEAQIKKAIDDTIAEYQITDPARIKRIAQRCKDGFIIGFREGRMQTAKKMLVDNCTIDEIIEITDLSLEQIEKLKASNLGFERLCEEA